MRVSGGDGERPTPEQLERRQRRMSAPENELPGGAGVTLVLAQGDDAAVGVTHVEGFSTGWRFTLAVRLRRARLGGDLHTMLSRFPHHSLAVPLEQRLLLGLEYADGKRASNLRDPRMDRPGDDDRLAFTQQSGGGDDRSHDQTYWVCPLPPPGPVTFVLAWPAFGIPETRVELDGATILDAAARSRLLWPPQPPEEHEEPPPPPGPAEGWFAENS